MTTLKSNDIQALSSLGMFMTTGIPFLSRLILADSDKAHSLDSMIEKFSNDMQQLGILFVFHTEYITVYYFGIFVCRVSIFDYADATTKESISDSIIPTIEIVDKT